MASNATYKITDVKELSRMTPANTMVTVYRVWLVTGRGSTGAVEIAEDDWSAETLPGILQEKANALDLPYNLPYTEE